MDPDKRAVILVDATYLPLRKGFWVRIARNARLISLQKSANFWLTAFDILCVGMYEIFFWNTKYYYFDLFCLLILETLSVRVFY